MGSAFGEQKLQSSFTLRVVEAVKRIKVSPMPRMAGLPWGLSLATVTIITILSLNPHLSIPGNIAIPNGSPLPVDTMVLKKGEVPVDILNTSEIPVTSTRQFSGDGLGSVVPGLHNALFMAPQAEGGTWTRKADMPTARSAFSTCVVNGRIYAIGGCGSPPPKFLGITEEYDPLTDKWEKKADMPTPRQNFSSCVVDGKIYTFGGWNPNKGGTLSAIEVYDPQTDTWAKRKDMPLALEGFFTGVIDGKIYVIGGYRDGECLSGVEVYDPLTEIWEKRPDMPTKRSSINGGVVNGKIYVIGGEAQIGPLNNGVAVTFKTVEEYDPITDKWTQKADMPTSRICGTAVVNGRIYAVGGMTWGPPQVIRLSTVEEYDPATDKWTKKNDVPTPRTGAVCFVKGKIYLIGGYDGEKLLSTVEEYDTGFVGESINPEGKLPTTWGDVRTVMGK